MIKIPLESVFSKIKEKAGLSDEQIEERIKQKLDQLSGLISREGAAHIIANELGVKLYEQLSGRMKMNKILAGMRDIEVVGRVAQIFDIKEFQRNDATSMVGSFVLGDETGTVRIVCWGEKAKTLRDLKQGMILKISNAYVRENNNRKEVHCNDRTRIILEPEGEAVAELNLQKEAIRKSLSELADNDVNVEVLGTIVQIFDPRFYNTCPECRKKLFEDAGSYSCPVHGKINANTGYVLNLVLDDGNTTMRAVLFNQQVEQLISKTHEEMLNYKANPDLFEAVKTDLLGEYIKVRGKVQKNLMFERTEFVVNAVMPKPDPQEEIERLKEQQKGNSQL